MVGELWKNITDCINSGLKRAVKEHIELTNGQTDLSYAPEYFLTVNIAEELKCLSGVSIILEESMGGADKLSGKKPEGWKRNRRYDIVVRRNDFSPYAAIEVKHRVYTVSERVIKDFKRISNAVNFKANGKSVFEMGIFVFYTVFDENNTNISQKNETIMELYSNLEIKLKDYQSNATLKANLIEPTKYPRYTNVLWGGGCLVLTSM
jgi:hypothetical protein